MRRHLKTTCLLAWVVACTGALFAGRVGASSDRPAGEAVAGFSLTDVDFGAALVGASSAPLTEVVSDVGAAPLVITAIRVVGEDAADFVPSFAFSLPLTIQPGQSVPITVTFTPTEPWTPGTRRARLQFADNTRDRDREVKLRGMGVTCAGPIPASRSGGRCADSDLDGLNDVWEDNDYIDLNNNGEYDPGVDFRFPHHRPFLFSSVAKTGSRFGRMFPTVTNPSVAIRPSSVRVTVVTGGPVGTATFRYALNNGAVVDEGPMEIRPVVDIADNLRLLFYASASEADDFVAGDTFSFTASTGARVKSSTNTSRTFWCSTTTWTSRSRAMPAWWMRTAMRGGLN